MDDWSKELFNLLETMTAEVEQFFQEVSDEIETVATQIHQSISDEIEQFLENLEDFFEPIVIVYAELDEIADEIDPPIGYKIEPNSSQNPACVGCRNYHGQVYGGNLLVCGMHPYGWEGSHCPDWEKMNHCTSEFIDD
jgi:hypothetical protein